MPSCSTTCSKRIAKKDMSSTFFSHGNTRFRYNADYSGETTITISHEDGFKELKVSTPALVAFAAHIIGGHLKGVKDSLPQEDLLWSVLDVSHSETEHLGQVRAKTEDGAFEKALELFGEQHDTDGSDSIAVRLA
jgi:hypothetical protein